MNWIQAVEVAKSGHCLRRLSESESRVIDHGDATIGGIQGAPIIETGHEGFRLMHAWTADEQPVLIFMGRWSKCLFVPDDEDRNATDWAIE